MANMPASAWSPTPEFMAQERSLAKNSLGPQFDTSMTPLLECWDQHQKAIDCLWNEVQRLDARARPVLRPENEAQQPAPEPDLSQSSPLFMEIYRSNERLNGMREYLTHIIDRLEC